MSCSSLTSIELPDTFVQFGNQVFWGCSGLQSVTIHATTPPQLGDGVFTNTTNNLVIYVPSGIDPVSGNSYVDIYKAASGWSSLASRIQAIPTT